MLRRSNGERIEASVVAQSTARCTCSYRNERGNLGTFGWFLNPRNQEITHTDSFHVPNVTSVRYQLGRDWVFVITSQAVPVSEARDAGLHRPRLPASVRSRDPRRGSSAATVSASSTRTSKSSPADGGHPPSTVARSSTRQRTPSTATSIRCARPSRTATTRVPCRRCPRDRVLGITLRSRVFGLFPTVWLLARRGAVPGPRDSATCGRSSAAFSTCCRLRLPPARSWPFARGFAARHTGVLAVVGRPSVPGHVQRADGIGGGAAADTRAVQPVAAGWAARSADVCTGRRWWRSPTARCSTSATTWCSDTGSAAMPFACAGRHALPLRQTHPHRQRCAAGRRLPPRPGRGDRRRRGPRRSHRRGRRTAGIASRDRAARRRSAAGLLRAPRARPSSEPWTIQFAHKQTCSLAFCGYRPGRRTGAPSASQPTGSTSSARKFRPSTTTIET